MIFEEAVKHLRHGMSIRYESFEFNRRSFSTYELSIKGSLGNARELLENFFDDNWYVEFKRGEWTK